MELSLSTVDDRTVITLAGRFDAHEARLFRQNAGPLLVPGADVTVDLSAVGFIDSTALAELVRMSRSLVEQNGSFRLRNVSVPVKVILQLTGLDLALDIETVAESV